MKNLTTKVLRIQQIPPQIDSGKTKHIYFHCKYYYKRLSQNIPPQEVRFNIIQCQIRGNFTSSALIHQCVESSEYTFFFCRKLFSLFFSSFIQSNKKKLRQDASNRNPKAMDQPLQVFWFHWFWIRKKCSQQLPLALCLRHLTPAGGEEEGAGGGGGGGVGGWVVGFWGCQRCPLPLRFPSMSLPKHSSLALRLADSASFLWVLKRDRRLYI